VKKSTRQKQANRLVYRAFMKLKWTIRLVAAAGLFLIGAKVFAAGPPSTNIFATTPPVFVPDLSHANSTLPDGILAWDEISKSTDAAADQQLVHFVFSFTNISSGNAVILSVHPSCGCTTAELPPLPWVIAPGTNGQIRLTVNLAGKSGSLIKTVTVSTDKGSKTLLLRINILPPVIPQLTEAERARGIAAAKIDRQAVFHGDCAQCHVKNIQGKYAKALFDSVCAICHEAEHRADMVPDLHNLKTQTNDEFWRTWIAHGKPGSLMPAFATSEGGPLTDIQIDSLAAYLNATIPSQVHLNK
jgi:mono/diheme cytochrome c family protein